MAMYAEASTMNYNPDYRYQTPENGSGATVDAKEADKDAERLKHDPDAVQKIADALNELVAS